MSDSRDDAGGTPGYFDHIDLLLNAQGWAGDEKSPGPVEVSVAVDGVIVNRSFASLARPDLMTIGASGPRTGFRLPIPKKALKRLKSTVHVLADGKVINGGPRSLDLSKLVSIRPVRLENQELVIKVKGWLGAAIKAQVKIDGSKSGFVKIPAADYLPGETPEVQIRWRLPDHVCDGLMHVYSLEIDQTSAVVRSDCTVLRYPLYQSHIDSADFSSMSGWAFRKDRSTPLHLKVLRDGEVIGTGLAREVRDDVLTALKISSNRLGFFINFDLPIEDDQAELKLVDADTNVVITGISIVNPYEALAATAYREAKAARNSDIASSDLLGAQVLAAQGAATFQSRPMENASPKASRISVIIPVYGGGAELVECMDSIFAATNETDAEYILVNDFTPELAISRYLRELELEGRPNVKIMHRKSNHGFSASVNLGMVAAGGNDVILLNADTVVQSGWIDRIIAAANQDPMIGTVTPFSSNGEICTLPYLCKSIPVEDLDLAARVDAIAAEVNAGALIDIPVAIGFCMYIRRECISEIGLFNAAKWGRGYGEEVDFCLKASARGWRHVLTADTFLIHRGAVSFGSEKLERVIESAKKINETFPFYDAAIERFIARDPVAAVRRNVNIPLIANALPQKRVLHVSHALTGGTDTYIRDLSVLYADEGYANIVLRFDTKGRSTMQINGDLSAFRGFLQSPHSEKYKSDEIETLKRHIELLGITHLHLHSPIGVDPELLSWLTSKFQYDLTLHDFAWACPSITFTTADGYYFGDNPDDPAGVAAVFNAPSPGLKPFADRAKRNPEAYRAQFRPILAGARRLISGSKDTADRLKALRFNGEFRIVAHPVVTAVQSLPWISAPYRKGDDIRVAVIGAISGIKGYDILLKCAEYALKHRLPIVFQVFGYTKDDTAFANMANVEILGRYSSERIGNILARHQPHVALFPNQWPETFSYTLSIALDSGVWPLVSDIGATAERVKAAGFGEVFDRSLVPEELCGLITKAAQSADRMRPAPEALDTISLDDYLGLADLD